jgi:hypothetical protein
MPYKKSTKAGINYCSPYKKKMKSKKKHNFTCYTKKELLNIIKKWNKTRKNNKINYKKTNTLKTLWNKVNEKYKKKCDSEWCWIEHKEEKYDWNSYDKINIPFKPTEPSDWENNPTEWLSNYDIRYVMKQYEQSHPSFLFIGPEPIDFSEKKQGKCIAEDICSLSVKEQLKNTKNQIGFVFNLDKHTGKGTHWVSLLCDFDRKGIFFYDSYGLPPHKEIQGLINKIMKECRKLRKKIQFSYNKIRHQFKNSECGIFCIHFLITMIETKISFSNYCRQQLTDDKMLKLRNTYFID